MNNIIRGIHLLKKAQKVCDGCESKPQANVAEKWLMLAYMQDWPAAYIKNAIFMLQRSMSHFNKRLHYLTDRTGTMINNAKPVPKIYTPIEKLPDDLQYVLVHLNINNWRDGDDPKEKRYWRVAKFIRGQTVEEVKKSRVAGKPDEDGNNLRPYCWDEFGPHTHFGQDVDKWCHLPE